MPPNNPQPSERDRKEIERISRKYGKEVVAAVALNTPASVNRGRPEFWKSEEVATLISIAECIANNPEFNEGRNVVDVLKEIAKMLRDPKAGLPALLAQQKPTLPMAADRIGRQSDQTMERAIRRTKSPVIDDDAGGR